MNSLYLAKLSTKLTKKLLCFSLLLTFGFSLNANADNAMRTIFNGMVAKTDPQPFATATRVGAVGGSFSYRQVQVNTNLVSMAFPKASVGCNGVDMFLGSFSMINGDQLVQVARGIAQGAAIYAFNVAVSAICADCAATINDIQNKLAALNKFTKDSCNATYSFLANNVGSPDSFSNSVGSGPGAVLNAIDGIFPDVGAAQNTSASENTKKAKAKDPIAFAEKFSGNLLYIGFMGIEDGTLDVGGVTELSGYRLAEQLMSLVGTIVVDWDSSGENANIKQVAPTMNVSDFIYGSASGTVQMLRCKPAPDPATKRKAQCLTLSQGTEAFVGLQASIRDTLLDAQTKILTNQPIEADQLRLINALGISNVIPTLNTLSSAEGYSYIQDISGIAATNFTISTLRSVGSKLNNMQASSEALASMKDDVRRLIDELKTQTKNAYDLQDNQTMKSKAVIKYWDDALIRSSLYRDNGYGG